MARPRVSPGRRGCALWRVVPRGADNVRMKITVIRSGGFAGLTRTWVVRVEEQDDPDSWIGLVDELPWGDRHRQPPQPDRFVYRIRVSRRQIVLPEQQLEGPWRELVDRVRNASTAPRTPAVPPTPTAPRAASA